MVLLVDTHIVHQEPLDDNQNSIENEKLNPKENQTSEENKIENNNFAPETTPEWSPNTTEDEPENLERNKKSPISQAPIAKELLKRSNEEQKIEQGGGVWFSL